MPTTTERTVTCPYCGCTSELAAGQASTRPRPGDLGICWKCAGLQVYTSTGVRAPNEQEVKDAVRDDRVRRIIEAVRRKAGVPGSIARTVLDAD